MKANRPVNRRRFLQATGTVVALPALESLGYRPFASATPAVARPRRAVFLGFGWGVTEETWLPGPQVTGPGYTLPPGLAPLARHKADFTVVQGLTNKFANEAHWGSTFWLTGANRYAEPGQSFHNSISVDQVVAERLGTSSRFASIQLSSPVWLLGGMPASAARFRLRMLDFAPRRTNAPKRDSTRRSVRSTALVTALRSKNMPCYFSRHSGVFRASSHAMGRELPKCP